MHLELTSELLDNVISYPGSYEPIIGEKTQTLVISMRTRGIPEEYIESFIKFRQQWKENVKAQKAGLLILEAKKETKLPTTEPFTQEVTAWILDNIEQDLALLAAILQYREPLYHLVQMIECLDVYEKMTLKLPKVQRSDSLTPQNIFIPLLLDSGRTIPASFPPSLTILKHLFKEFSEYLLVSNPAVFEILPDRNLKGFYLEIYSLFKIRFVKWLAQAGKMSVYILHANKSITWLREQSVNKKLLSCLVKLDRAQFFLQTYSGPEIQAFKNIMATAHLDGAANAFLSGNRKLLQHLSHVPDGMNEQKFMQQCTEHGDVVKQLLILPHNNQEDFIRVSYSLYSQYLKMRAELYPEKFKENGHGQIVEKEPLSDLKEVMKQSKEYAKSKDKSFHLQRDQKKLASTSDFFTTPRKTVKKSPNTPQPPKNGTHRPLNFNRAAGILATPKKRKASVDSSNFSHRPWKMKKIEPGQIFCTIFSANTIDTKILTPFIPHLLDDEMFADIKGILTLYMVHCRTGFLSNILAFLFGGSGLDGKARATDCLIELEKVKQSYGVGSLQTLQPTSQQVTRVVPEKDVKNLILALDRIKKESKILRKLLLGNNYLVFKKQQEGKRPPAASFIPELPIHLCR